MQPTPASRPRLAARASSTIARSSSIEYWVESTRSVGEAIPPDSITLTWWAPRRSCSRAARRTSVTPSATTVMAGVHGCWSSSARPGGRESPCPPVCDSALPPKTSLGPGSRPSATAADRPKSAPATSRTVVKPRSSIPLRIPAAAVTCTCASISPGIRVIPPASSTVASPPLTFAVEPTSTIRSPSTSTACFSISSPASASRTAASRIRMRPESTRTTSQRVRSLSARQPTACAGLASPGGRAHAPGGAGPTSSSWITDIELAQEVVVLLCAIVILGAAAGLGLLGWFVATRVVPSMAHPAAVLDGLGGAIVLVARSGAVVSTSSRPAAPREPPLAPPKTLARPRVSAVPFAGTRRVHHRQGRELTGRHDQRVGPTPSAGQGTAAAAGAAGMDSADAGRADQRALLRPRMDLRAQTGRRALPGLPPRRPAAAAVADPPTAERGLPRAGRPARSAAQRRLHRRRGDRRVRGAAHQLRAPPAPHPAPRPRQRAAQRRRGVLLPLRHPPSRGQRHLRAPAPRPEVAAAQRAVLRGPTSLPAPPQHRGRGAVPGRLPQGLGGPDRQARRRAVPARPLGGLAEAQVRQRAGVRDRRLDRSDRHAGGAGGAADRLLRPRCAALRRQGRHRLQPGRAAGPAVAARPAGTRRAAVRARRAAAEPRPLGAPRAGRPDRLHRGHPRRQAAPPPLPGPARRQAPARGGPGTRPPPLRPSSSSRARAPHSLTGAGP